MKLSLGKKIAAVGVAGAVLVGAGTVAWADSNSGSSPAPASTPAAATPATATGKAAQKHAGIFDRADHGTIEIKMKAATTGTATWQTVTFDRGQVSAATAGQITLARPDGQSVTLTIGPNTKWQGVTSEAQIVTGKGALVVSEDGTALIIRQRVASAAGASGSATSGSPAAAPAPAA